MGSRSPSISDGAWSEIMSEADAEVLATKFFHLLKAKRDMCAEKAPFLIVDIAVILYAALQNGTAKLQKNASRLQTPEIED